MALINGRRIVQKSVDPSGLAAQCARSWLVRHAPLRSDNSAYPCVDSVLSISPEAGKGKGFGIFTTVDLPSGSHVGWVEGELTLIHPDPYGTSYSFQLYDDPPVYVDSGVFGSLVTLINEDVITPNCTARALVHRGLLRIQVSTNRLLVAGSVLSLSYRDVDPASITREFASHHWGRVMGPSGGIGTGTRRCANRRYHPTHPPQTSLVCMECSQRFSLPTSFCSEACFASHVADHASADTSDIDMCTPLRTGHSGPVKTRAAAPKFPPR